MEQTKHISLLSNEPCREDAFEGHSHKNIAIQIARLIKEDNNRHIIGIEGGWGSGKSNLISLVNKELNGVSVYDKDYNHRDSTFPFFIYDAWGHQADFQRRAILEELTQELTIDKKILDERKWKQKLEELLAKRKKTTTKEVPHLGIGLIISILLCVLTPLIVYFVELVPKERWLWRLLIAAFPYLLGFIWAIMDRVKSIKKNGQEVTSSNIVSELILVYKDQIKENETYTTISEKEPSSAEFKSWMDKVDADLKTLNKTLIIVFDNMDRLPSQKVESLWSSIHSFFSDKTYNNIKVLIPFDRKHVQNAFKSEDLKDERYGNDFINKTFDVVFRVPPPIMSGWKSYMADMWKKAFGDDAVLDIPVTQIYDALSMNHTPRKIIAFINEVVTVKMTMGDDIPDRYIALFILGKEKIEENPIEQLLNPDFMGDVEFEYEKDPNTIKYLSAIYYQLPVDDALDVVFTKEATDALNSGNSERLRDMMEHIDMQHILGKAILKVSDVEKATVSLAALDDYLDISDSAESPSWLRNIWEDLYKMCLNKDTDWNEIKEYHIPLFQHLYDDTLAESLVKGYLSIKDEKWNAKVFVEAIDRLSENNDIIARKLSENKRKVTPKLFLDLLQYTKGSYENYGVEYDLKELDEYLAGLEQDVVMSIDVIPYIGIENNKLPKYQAKLQEWLGDPSSIDTDGIETLFERLKEISDKPLNFADFFTDADIYNAWANLSDDDNPFKYDILAMRIARNGNFNTTYSTHFDDILENYEEEEAEALAKVIEYYVCFGELLIKSDYYKEYPLICDSVKLLIANNYGVKRASIMECLSYFDKAVSDYEVEAKHLFCKLNDWNRYISFAKTKITSMPSGLIELAGEVDITLAKTIHTACEEYYAEQTQDQWKEHIIKKDNTYRIWKLYHPKKYQANFDALKALLKDYASGATATQPDKKIVDEWLNICIEVKHSVKGLFNEISAILKKDSSINKQKLLFFGEYILNYTEPDKQKDFVLKLIPTEIIGTDVIVFIIGHLDRLRECEISDEFREKLKHLSETSMKDDERIIAVCQNFGIELEAPQPDNKEE